ncbi:MAG: DUF4294 domain-containing protein [Rikenellaceae bacterium]
MKNNIIYLIIISMLCLTATELHSQNFNRGCIYYAVILNGDTIQAITMPELNIYGKGKRKKSSTTKRDVRKYNKLINAVLVTYPIAKDAGRTLKRMEAHIKTLDSERAKNQYVKTVEDSLKTAYMPLVKRMSMYQGMILLKLIDRETGKTSYNLIQELRGNLSAFFWQNITRLFGGDLKAEYDKEDEDAMIEEIIILYEIGVFRINKK